MGFWKRLFGREKRSSDGCNISISALGSRYTESKALQLSTVYRCVACISDAVAQLPIQILKVNSKGYKKLALSHPAYWLLNKEPSHYMSRFMMLKSMVTSMLLRGNAFVYVERDDDGNALWLEFLHPDTVTIVDN